MIEEKERVKVRNIYTDAVAQFDTVEAAYDYFDAVDGIGWVVRDEDGREIFRDEDGFFTVTEDGDEIRY